MSRAVTIFTGALRYLNPCSAISPAITIGRGRLARRLIDQHKAASFFYGFNDGFHVKRSDGAGIYYFGADAFASRAFGGRSDFFTIQPVATIVTSLPARFTSATPNGTTYSPSGTAPFVEHEHVVVQINDGIVVANRGLHQPLRVRGIDGSATFKPGMPIIMP